jgi:hypothetical protein
MGQCAKTKAEIKEKLKHIMFLIDLVFPHEVFLMRSQLFVIRFCHACE